MGLITSFSSAIPVSTSQPCRRLECLCVLRHDQVSTAEMIPAADKVDELDSLGNQPVAYKLELALFPDPVFQVALRL